MTNELKIQQVKEILLQEINQKLDQLILRLKKGEKLSEQNEQEIERLQKQKVQAEAISTLSEAISVAAEVSPILEYALQNIENLDFQLRTLKLEHSKLQVVKDEQTIKINEIKLEKIKYEYKITQMLHVEKKPSILKEKIMTSFMALSIIVSTIVLFFSTYAVYNDKNIFLVPMLIILAINGSLFVRNLIVQIGNGGMEIGMQNDSNREKESK